MDCSKKVPSCIVLTCYYRPKPGGFCKRLFRGIRALLDRGCVVHYLAVAPFPIDHPNCHYHRFPWPEQHASGYAFWGVFHLLAPLMLLGIGLRCRANRLFAFGHTYSLLLQPLRLVKHLPLVVFLRADTIRNHQIKQRSRALTALEHLLEGLGMAGAKMHGVSEDLVRSINARHRILRPSSSGILRNEIPIMRDGTRKKAAICLPMRTACVGVLEPRKNQRFLLEVFKGVAAEQAQLCFYGTGPDEQLLRDAVLQESMSDRIHFMGWVPSEHIWSEVDLLLMPSLHEGAPNAVLEALGCGVPVLASDIPEHREILPHEHLLPTSCPDQWIELLKASKEIIIKIERDQFFFSKKLIFDWEEKFAEAILR